MYGRDYARKGDVNIGLGNILNAYVTPGAGNPDVRLAGTATYYIKVSGVTERPILPEDRQPFDEPHTTLDFAKQPNNIRLGDCLLEVAVGGKCFLPYYACASAALAGARPVRYGTRTNCGVMLRPSTRGVVDSVLPCNIKLFVSFGGSPRILTQVVARRPVVPGRRFDVTPALAEDLGIEGIQRIKWVYAR